MALDLETIKATYYKGYADMTPQGQNHRSFTEIVTQFEDWPEDVKKVFDYDPEGAEALLDEAGYKRGADGIRFKTKLLYLKRYDLNYAEIAVSYWKKIGIDVEGTDVQPLAQYIARRGEGDFEMISAEAAQRWFPLDLVSRFISTTKNKVSNVSEPDYDAMYEAAAAATTLEKQNRIVKEMHQYAIEKFWQIWGGMAQRLWRSSRGSKVLTMNTCWEAVNTKSSPAC